MAGRKPKGYEIQQKLDTYLETYELDDLNKANDYASLRQLASFEIIIDKMQTELAEIKKMGDDTKKVKDLTAALNDASNSYTSLQKTLGIDRSKRASEGDESVLSYVEKLKDQAKKVWAKRLKKVACPKCKLTLAKYYVYITEKGEEGALEYAKKSIEKIKYTFKVECPECGEMIEVNEITNEGEDST